MISDKLIRQITNCSVVSFDVFDTLVLRSCTRPDSVYKIVAQISKFDIKKFHNDRIKAEINARRKKHGEITIEDIYDNLPNEYAEDKKSILETEEFVEKNIVYPNTEILEIFQYCVKRKKVIIASDMYLSKSILEEILKSCGIVGYSKLYISRDYGKQKSTGKLFEIILQDQKIQAGDMLHIGDNFKSDYLMPKQQGISVYRYKRKSVYDLTNDDICIMNAFIERKIVNADFWYKFGYKYLGPALFGYVTWLNFQLHDRDIKKVFFFAREGQLIKKAFDLVKHDEFEEKYLYVSRRSLAVPAIAEANDIDEFLTLRPIYGRVRVKDQFEKLGLSEDEFENCVWYKKCKDKTFSELSKGDKKKAIEDLYSKAIAVSERELTNLLSYLKQENVCGKFAVVDLGWNGSMQRALANIMHKENMHYDMKGFFLAQRDEYYKNKDYIENYGFLFEYGNASKKENLLLNSGTNLLELLFTADHGTTLKYEEVNGCINPIIADFEYTETYDKLKKCQDASLDFIRDFLMQDIRFQVDNYKHYFDNMYSVLENPDKETISKFGDFNYSDLNETKLYLACRRSLLPLKEFIREFNYSGWKVAFLNRNLKMKKGFEIYCLLRSMFN